MTADQLNLVFVSLDDSEHQDAELATTLSTLVDGRRHEFDRWTDVWHALALGANAAGCVLDVLGTSGAAKVSAADADDLRDGMKLLRAAICVLLDQRAQREVGGGK